MNHLNAEKLDVLEIEEIEEEKQSLCNSFNEKQNPIRIVHYRRVSSEISGIFSAPPGVNPFHVAATEVRKLATGDSKYVFIWPQQNSRNCSSMPNLLIPIIRTILTGLVSLNTIHLWPGEFMPNSLPSILPPPMPPLKCNVIEPNWNDNNYR